jgi:hypothetical protein
VILKGRFPLRSVDKQEEEEQEEKALFAPAK